MNIIVHTDGGARGNPGPAAIGIVIEHPGKAVQGIGKYIGSTTNNVAEYTAVKEALKILLAETERGTVQFFLDSLLVVNQLSGIYNIKEPTLRELAQTIKQLEREWQGRVFYQHIPRAKNAAADRLVNQALDQHLQTT